MRKFAFVLIGLSFLIVLAACRTEPEPPPAPEPPPPPDFAYPDTPTGDVVDDYHGIPVPDPYRWLEEDVRESPRVAEWVAAQNEVTRAHLDELPMRDVFRARLTELWNYERHNLPVKRDDKYFYTRNDGLQNQSVFYVQEGLDGEPRLLIDPNTWSDDGTVNLAQWVIDPHGRRVAYAIQDAGSDWRTWRVLDVASGENLEDELEWLKFTSVSWDAAGEGFYYSRYPVPEPGQAFQTLNHDQKVHYHRLGTDQAEDRLIYERPDEPKWGYDATVTDDGAYLVITIWKGTDNRYRIAWLDLADADAEPVMLIDEFAHDYTLIGNDGSRLFFRTNRDAPNNRVITIDLTRPEPKHWEELIPESAHVLRNVDHVGGHFIANYLADAASHVEVYTIGGENVDTVELPGIGTASGFDGKPDVTETFYSFASFNRPATLYRYDVASGESALWKAPETDIDPDRYIVRQVFYSSLDGTRVPMFIAHRADVELDGSTPTLLYAYGGFNQVLTPNYSVHYMAWMQAGGIFAQANLRGGGEYGREWHQAGTRTNKQNVFDDFIAAAEYLIEEGYTSSENLAIYGRSNGGLLIGAVTNQRPDLYGAALPAVGVMDMLRFHRFTAGRFWVDDYGSPDDPEEFEALYAYSPYHNIRAGTEYPPVLVTTADTDDRVVPGHSFKYAARLQAAQAGDAPVLIRIETRAGHGAGSPVTMLIDQYADMWAFAAHHTGLEVDEQ